MLRQFDMPKRDFGESLRMLVQNLAIVSPPPAAEDLMNLIDLFRVDKLIISFTPAILGEQEQKHDYRTNHTSM
jgi:hypothetical protein